MVGIWTTKFVNGDDMEMFNIPPRIWVYMCARWLVCVRAWKQPNNWLHSADTPYSYEASKNWMPHFTTFFLGHLYRFFENVLIGFLPPRLSIGYTSTYETYLHVYLWNRETEKAFTAFCKEYGTSDEFCLSFNANACLLVCVCVCVCTDISTQHLYYSFSYCIWFSFCFRLLCHYRRTTRHHSEPLNFKCSKLCINIRGYVRILHIICIY